MRTNPRSRSSRPVQANPPPRGRCRSTDNFSQAFVRDACRCHTFQRRMPASASSTSPGAMFNPPRMISSLRRSGIRSAPRSSINGVSRAVAQLNHDGIRLRRANAAARLHRTRHAKIQRCRGSRANLPRQGGERLRTISSSVVLSHAFGGSVILAYISTGDGGKALAHCTPLLEPLRMRHERCWPPTERADAMVAWPKSPATAPAVALALARETRR